MSIEKSKKLQKIIEHVSEARKNAFNKLLEAYDLSEDSEDIKIIYRNGESYIILFNEIIWKETLILNEEKFEYKLDLISNDK
jgi:hypothetical protein